MEKNAAVEKFDKTQSQDKCSHAMKEIPGKDNDDWAKAKESMSKCGGGGALKDFGEVELYDGTKEKPVYKAEKEKFLKDEDLNQTFDKKGKPSDKTDDKLTVEKGYEK